MLFLDSPTISMQRESEMFVVSQHNEKKYSASTEPICCGFSYWNFRLTHAHTYRNAHIFGILSLSRERELVLTNGIRILVWASSFNQICKASVGIIGLLVLKFLVFVCVQNNKFIYFEVENVLAVKFRYEKVAENPSNIEIIYQMESIWGSHESESKLINNISILY